MNKIILTLTLIITCMMKTHATPVGSGFNYQGEISDNEIPANGNYDILFKAFPTQIGGVAYDIIPEFLAITVNNGLFNIDNVDFGDALYDGSEYWIEVSIWESGTDPYTTLSPRQRLNATPYAVQADFLAPHGANTGDVLIFDGISWVGNSLDLQPTPWVSNGSNISFTTGRIGVNTTNPLADLHINGNMQSDGDSNIDGDLHVDSNISTSGEINIDGDNNIGGNTLIGPRGVQAIADAKLDVNSTASGTTADPFRVRKNGDIKFYVDSNGGTSVGSWDTPPANGLKVAGNTLLDGETTFTGDAQHSGDVKQDFANHGLVKYLLFVDCLDSSDNATILRSYDGINAGTVTASYSLGKCKITFPFDMSNSFFQVSSTSAESVYANCWVAQTNRLFCRIKDVNGNSQDAQIMVTIF